MAQRRMFSPAIVCSDAFLDMPTSTQALYFQLGMKADDDGFVNPKSIMRLIGAKDDDLSVLLAKRFALPFENGVIVIKHWRVNNLVRKDWYKPTIYDEYKKRLNLKENGSYTDDKTKGEPLSVTKSKRTVNGSATQVRLGKVNTKENSKEFSSYEVEDENKPKPKTLGKDKEALSLQRWCYDRMEAEYGVRPTQDRRDHFRVLAAIKALGVEETKTMFEDVMAKEEVQSVRGVFTNLKIDQFRRENV